MENVFAVMHWRPTCRYKALGHVANSPRGLILAFDLDDSITYNGRMREIVDPQTGEIRKTKSVFYPQKFKDRIGTPYDAYVAGVQMSLFEDFEDVALPIMTYNDMTDEDELIGDTAPIESENSDERKEKQLEEVL